MNVQVTVNAGQVTVALEKFSGGLADRRDLMNAIGQGQLVSVYRTFDEEGSPAGSWPKLAASTLRNKKYRAGHKLLIMRGLLRNSIHVDASGHDVKIGTNLKYARVHQLGSRDYGVDLETVENPLQFMTTANVKGHSRRQKSQDQVTTYWKGGRIHTRLVKAGVVEVKAHSRTARQNIPPRPFLVFRPEDPERIRQQVQTFVALRARQAGLGAI